MLDTLNPIIRVQYDLDAWPKSWLTVSNPKTLKGEAAGWMTAILHLSPADSSGFEMCPYRSKECTKLCLNTSGHGGINLDENRMNPVQVARIRRTRALMQDYKRAIVEIADEIARFELRAIRKGLKLAVRLDGLSDNLWERKRAGKHANLMAMFPTVQFYDYTKIPVTYREKRVSAIPNYYLTFSLSENNDEAAEGALIAGYNVAVAMNVRKGQPLPERFRVGVVNAQVIDGDKTDLRFLDEPGLVVGKVVGLRAKGFARGNDDNGFIRNVNL